MVLLSSSLINNSHCWWKSIWRDSGRNVQRRGTVSYIHVTFCHAYWLSDATSCKSRSECKRFFLSFYFHPYVGSRGVRWLWPGWCMLRWRPQWRRPHWQWAGTAGIWRCCRRRSCPTSQPSRCCWSYRLSGWCQTPPSPRLSLRCPGETCRVGNLTETSH